MNIIEPHKSKFNRTKRNCYKMPNVLIDYHTHPELCVHSITIHLCDGVHVGWLITPDNLSAFQFFCVPTLIMIIVLQYDVVDVDHGHPI